MRSFLVPVCCSSLLLPTFLSVLVTGRPSLVSIGAVALESGASAEFGAGLGDRLGDIDGHDDDKERQKETLKVLESVEHAENRFSHEPHD